MIFLKTAVSLLNAAQQFVTSTVGANIGLNNIFQQITASLDNLEIILDKTKPSGGLNDLNIQTAGITNVSTNLIMDTVKQVGQVDTADANVATNTIISFNITTQKTNQKIHLTVGGRSIPIKNQVVSGLSQSRAVFSCTIKQGATTIGTFTASQSNNNLGTVTANVDSWAFLGIAGTRSEVITLPSVGTYTITVDGGHSGNYTQVSRVTDGFLTYFMN